MRISALLLVSTLAGAALCAEPAPAADRSFLGIWTITGAQNAPWAAAGETPSPSDLKMLMDKSVTFSPARIVAPPPLGCSRPHYEMKSYTPDMLFQGTLPDPAKQAPSLGFTSKAIPTLETGCPGAIDFHFVTAGKAMFGLNDRIYVMTRPKH